MTLNEFEHACLWEQAICLDCEETFDPGAPDEGCPACGSDAVFLARDLARIEAWLAEIDRE